MRALLQPAQAIGEIRQPLHDGLHAPPFLVRKREKDGAHVHSGRRDRAVDLRRARNDDVVADFDVSVDDRGAADLAVPADAGASRDADATGDRRVRADPAVVAYYSRINRDAASHN